jgi:hypothetical protein
MKNYKVIITGLLSVALTAAGCGTLKDKFKFKHKKEEPTQKYQLFEDYTQVSKTERYEKYYLYWRSWHEEWINRLSDNSLRDMRNSEETIGNLVRMQELLPEEKRIELQGHLDTLRKIKDSMSGNANSSQLRSSLEREKRLIEKKFSYSDVKDLLEEGTVPAVQGKPDAKSK